MVRKSFASVWRPRLRKAVVGMTVSAVVATGVAVGVGAPASAADLLPGPAPIEQRSTSTVTSDALPTVQIDSGIVWAQVIAGNTAYAGGSFSNARPAGANPGQSLMPRSNLLAYNIDTGVATAFAPTINGTVKSLAVSPDGATLYVGGSFTQVNGQTRFNVAAFNVATGALLTTFRPAIGGSYVNAIVATGSTVYFGGLIGAAGGVTRKNLAAASASNGAVLGWAPTADLQVDTMVTEPGNGKLIIGGRFGAVNGSPQRGLAALDLTTGSVLPWAAPATVKNGVAVGGSGAGKAGIWALTADSSAVYGTGWVFANKFVGNLEGMFAAEAGSGAIRWIADCHGDHYGVYSDGTNVYSTGHEHDCQTAGGLPQAYPAPGNLRHATVYTAAAKGTLTTSPFVNDIYADWGGYPAPAAVNWFPDWTTGTASGTGQAGWTATGNGKYFLVGGEFPFVNGQRSQGIARFSNTPASATQGPRLSGVNWTPTARSVSAGTARIAIPANWDRDDRDLSYELYEQGTATAVATTTKQSTFWNTPNIVLTATGLAAGATKTYRVVAKDGNGNSANSAWVTVTVSSADASTYANAVLDDGAALLWRLGGADGGADWAGTNDAVFNNGVGTTPDDALAGEANGSATLPGNNGFASTTSTSIVGSAFATELWFKTDTTTGGKLVGYGDNKTGDSGNYDRHVYMKNNGHLVFGSYPGFAATVQGSTSYNDNAWHHLVAQQGPQGQQLYVDGQLVGSSTVTGAQSYAGYWKIGGDNLNGWPDRPATSYFRGAIDEFAVYGATLTSAQVSNHYDIGRGTATPTAAMAVSGTELSRSFDASASTAPAGRTITGYAWEFGDGDSGAGVTTSHTYDEPGSYTVTLTVTDSTGRTGVATSTVVVTPPHTAPVAAIGHSESGLTVSFDSDDSTAANDATITDYSWSFGDGQTSTLADPTHEYDDAGTYAVTLTVTDSLGFSSAAASASVTVTSQSVVARDDFGRTVASGWGAAQIGGTWSTVSGMSVAGGVGRVSLNPGQTKASTLSTASGADVAGRLVFSADKVANGGGLHFNYLLHKSTAGDYRLKLRTLSTGTVTASLVRTVGTTETTLATRTLTGYTFTGGAKLQIRFETSVAGGTTTLRGSVWPDGTAEPASWQLTATDSTAALQGAGQVGVLAYLSGSTTNGPVVVSVDDLTVTRGGGTAAHAAPVAVIGASASGLTATLTGNGSTASGGATVTGFAWDFGDGASSTENAPAHAYAAAGTYVVKLIVTDSLGATSTAATSSITVSHAAPVAAFVASAAGLALSVDASTSQVFDGATLSYSWNWGDGSPAGFGGTASHSYGAAGDYAVTLTVSDSLGASASTSQPVTVSAISFIARDDFERVLAAGWGTAPTGGAWGTTAGFSVADGVGKATVTPGQTRTNLLTGVSAQNVDARLAFSSDKVATGGGLHFNYLVHKTAAGDYRLKLRISATGVVTVSVAKVLGTTETLLVNKTLTGYTHTAGGKLQLRLQSTTVAGSTTLNANVWPDGATEPGGWLVSATDAQAQLQTAGQVGIVTYLSGSTTNAPVTVSVDNLEVR